MVKWLSDIERQDVGTVGGKATVLGGLMKAGFLVPHGFVVVEETTDGEVLEAFDTLGAKSVAVRSSAVSEDGTQNSWAGILESFLHVSREQLLERLRACRHSQTSARAREYAQAVGTAGRMAVLVQSMVASEVSGVAFSRHPVTGADEVFIEAVRGLGESVVSGLVIPEQVQVGKASTLLTANQVQELTDLARRIEAWQGLPADIEWAYEQGQVWVLQARPLTALP